MSQEFVDRSYLVVGASSGIGRSVCQILSGRGAGIILVARDRQRLEDALRDMPPGRHKALPFDVCEIGAIGGLIASVHEAYGRIDGCVYCVGNGDHARLRDLTFERLHRVMLSNYYAYLEVIRCLIKKKPKAQPLSIVGISSLASNSHEKYLTAYAASKAAMEAATRCLATELCSRNTRITTIRPGVVNTGRLAVFNELTGDLGEHVKKSGFQPHGLIEPEEVAQLAAYLLSDAAGSISGAGIPINGGAAC